MEKKDLLIASYAGYTFEDMEALEQTHATTANNDALTPAIRKDALEVLEVVNFAKEVYMEAVKKGVNVSGMRLDAAFYIATGKTFADCKAPGAITKATSGFVSATDKIADVAVESVRKTGNWLGQKLIAWTSK